MTKIFFDTEFTGLHKNTTLISIGLIAQNGEQIYAELTDYDKTQCDNWIEENVIKNLITADPSVDFEKIKLIPDFQYGDKERIRFELTEWLKKFKEVQFVSDVSHYDFMLLIDLLVDNALALPENICASCHDINQDIAEYFGISEAEAFNKSREEILKIFDITISGIKHNALYDAAVIKSVYESIY